jgi:hypothetical protein
MVKDNKRACWLCRQWEPGPIPEGEAGPSTGWCRKNAPLVTGGMMSAVETVWPITSPNDWCGQFERIERPFV